MPEDTVIAGGLRRGPRAVVEYAATYIDERGAQRVPCENRDAAVGHVAKLREMGLRAHLEMRRCQPWTRIGPVSTDEAVAMIRGMAFLDPAGHVSAWLDGTIATWTTDDAVAFVEKATTVELIDTFTFGYRLSATAPDSTVIRFEVMR